MEFIILGVLILICYVWIQVSSILQKPTSERSADDVDFLKNSEEIVQQITQRFKIMLLIVHIGNLSLGFFRNYTLFTRVTGRLRDKK